MAMTLYHGSREPITKVDFSKTVDGGFHCGDMDQARMRNGHVLHRVTAHVERTQRARDTGGNWAARIRKARNRGYDAIVYLNRHEGIPTERIEALFASGDLDRLDQLSDAQFRKLVPEARDSYILLAPDTVFRIEPLL